MPLPFSRLSSIFLPHRLTNLRTSIRTHPLRTFTLTLLYIATPTLYLIRHHICVYAIDGPSMSPLLSPTFNTTGNCDIVLFRRDMRLSSNPASEGGDGSKGELERGMVVSFSSPRGNGDQGWPWAWKPVVKRIVAMEGDTVMPLTRRRRYNAAGRSSDAHAHVHLKDHSSNEPITVPFGHVWVEGVNTDDTIDSNEYGPISKSLITGVATKIVLPAGRRGEIDWKRDWEKNCRDTGRVKLARDDEAGRVPHEWAM